MRDQKCQVDREEPVKTEADALGEQVPELDIAKLASAPSRCALGHNRAASSSRPYTFLEIPNVNMKDAAKQSWMSHEKPDC